MPQQELTGLDAGRLLFARDQPGDDAGHIGVVFLKSDFDLIADIEPEIDAEPVADVLGECRHPSTLVAFRHVANFAGVIVGIVAGDEPHPRAGELLPVTAAFLADLVPELGVV